MKKNNLQKVYILKKFLTLKTTKTIFKDALPKMGCIFFINDSRSNNKIS